MRRSLTRRSKLSSSPVSLCTLRNMLRPRKLSSSLIAALYVASSALLAAGVAPSDGALRADRAPVVRVTPAPLGCSQPIFEPMGPGVRTVDLETTVRASVLTTDCAPASRSFGSGRPPLAVPHLTPTPKATPKPTPTPSHLRIYAPTHAPTHVAPTFSSPPVVVAVGERAWATGHDAVAVSTCESGGRPNVVSDHGGVTYYGKWQFNLSTWRGVGGSGLPSDASVYEQDHRAYLLWESRGWEPWTCRFVLGR